MPNADNHDEDLLAELITLRRQNAELETTVQAHQQREFLSQTRGTHDRFLAESVSRGPTERKQAEKTLRQSPQFFQSALDALSAYIAILDDKGEILAINEAWRRSAVSHGFQEPCGIGMNYLTICDMTTNEGAVEASTVAQGIRDVLAQRCEQFTQEYDCHSPDAQRWFQLCVTPFEDGRYPRAVVMHEEITERKQAERALQIAKTSLEHRVEDRTTELQLAQQKLRSLATRHRRILEEERRRISRDLHDNCAQLLSAIRLDLSWLRQQLKADSSGLQERLSHASLLTDQIFSTLEEVMSGLHPRFLDDLGLGAAIDWQLKEWHQLTGIAVARTGEIEEHRLHPDQALDLFRVVQESLTNVIRHARATHVYVDLRIQGNGLHLAVQDNGRGFSDSGQRISRGMGVLGMHERMLSWGGTVEVAGRLNRGTRVEVYIPLQDYTSREEGQLDDDSFTR